MKRFFLVVVSILVGIVLILPVITIAIVFLVAFVVVFLTTPVPPLVVLLLWLWDVRYWYLRVWFEFLV